MDNRNEEELRASFLNQPLMPYIGAKLSTISPGRASIEVVYQKNIAQQHGLFHGGVSGAIADNAAEEMAYDLSYEYPLNDSTTITPFIYIVEESAANKDDAVGIGTSVMFKF